MSSITVEKIWLIDVQNFFSNDEAEVDIDRPISIFNIPKTLKAIKPEAYTPQMIALGPYHHWSEGVYEMERYKLTAAKRVQTLFKSSLKFQDLVDKLVKLNLKIRACYHKYLTIDDESLAWMMAIDGLFLLQFLHIYVNKNESVLANSARMSFLVDSKGKKLGYDSLLKDIMMLENQIPLFVMKKILRIQCSSRAELADNMLPPMFLGVCKEIAPLKLKEDCNPAQVLLKRAHLLDLLYHLMVPRCVESLPPHQGGCAWEISSKNGSSAKKRGFLKTKLDNLNVFKELWDKVSAFGFSQQMKKYINAFTPLVSNLSSHLGVSGSNENGDSSKVDGDESILRVEEIMIPCVADLASVGVKFQPTEGDISTIKFQRKHKIFHLPVIRLDVNSEVIMRNLVAYEASAISGPLVFGRYTELMNGIVDSGEDVKILAESGIIKSEFSYEEVANIWNGMSKSIRLSHVDFIDETIKGVNDYFYNTARVRFYRAFKASVYGSWRMLVILATLTVIGLMFIQSFCTVYDCPRILHLVSNQKE